MGFFSAFKKFFGSEEDSRKRQDDGDAAGHAGATAQDSASSDKHIQSDLEIANPQLPDDDKSHQQLVESATAGSAEAEPRPSETVVSAPGNDNVIVDVCKTLPAQTDGGKTDLPQTESPAAESGDNMGADAVIPTSVAEPDGDSKKVEDVQESPFQDTPVAAADSLADSGDDEMLARLRLAEPRLSTWLAIVLEGIDDASDEFWRRLAFLLDSLQAPKEEIDAFIAEFRVWLERMEYFYIDEFRSELQYRLALALDLEDEEDERNRLLRKLTAGLARTREEFGKRLDFLFSDHGELDQAFWDEMEELFIMADLGYETSVKLTERLRERARAEKVTQTAHVRELLMNELEEVFRQPRKIKAVNKPEVVLMIGVNGVGKTTTIAKLAYRDQLRGKKTLIVAGDTFRAAAIDQLKVWADRAGSEFYAKPQGSDPASVAWEAMDYALGHDIDVVYIDTAGRLQTKVNLMEELAKIRQVIAKKHPGAPHRVILTLDATTGQNALSQARLFKESAGADELILSKLDGTAKGGVAIAVAMQENLPITFVGLGEKMEDLRPFDGEAYARVLLGAQTGQTIYENVD